MGFCCSFHAVSSHMLSTPSDRYSRFRHFDRPSRIPAHHLIHLPGPLCSTGITRSHGSYGASDSCIVGSHRACLHAGLPASRTQPSKHSVLNHLMSPAHRFHTLPLSVGGFSLRRAGLHLSLADSPGHQAESGSSSYGLLIHFPLLPTPPRGDAVTFSYRPESACLERTSTILFRYARWRTRGNIPVARIRRSERSLLHRKVIRGRRSVNALLK